MSRSMVVIELAGDAPLPRDLAAGGVFVPDCALRLAEECDLVVCGAGQQLRIPARVVYVDPRGGAGLELLGFSSEMMAQLTELATPAAASSELRVARLEAAAATLDGDDLAIPGSVAHDATARTEAADRFGGDEDDLAIPVSDEVPYDPPASNLGPGARPDVFCYGKPGLAYRGGVVHGRSTSATVGGTPDDDDDHDDLGFTEALAAELDAELGLADFADADDEPGEPGGDREAGERGGGDDPGRSDEALELDLINLEAGGADTNEAEDDHRDDEAGGGDDDYDPDPLGGAGGSDARGSSRRFPRNVHERLRGLTLAAQVKMAMQGELHERIVLERMYGKNVWETLLRNPRLTAPEVARIARYGSLPRVLLEIIVGNNAWLQIAEIRRALLSNARLAVDQIMKVLRLTPKHELKLAAIQTAYPHAVRNAAKMLMRGDA